MKLYRVAKIILDLHKDPTIDPQGLLDERTAHPFIVKYKKHWWSRWKYVMDEETGCPKLFFCNQS